MDELDVLERAIDSCNWAAGHGDVLAAAQSAILTYAYNQVNRDAPGFTQSPTYRQAVALAKAICRGDS